MNDKWLFIWISSSDGLTMIAILSAIEKTIDCKTQLLKLTWRANVCWYIDLYSGSSVDTLAVIQSPCLPGCGKTHITSDQITKHELFICWNSVSENKQLQKGQPTHHIIDDSKAAEGTDINTTNIGTNNHGYKWTFWKEYNVWPSWLFHSRSFTPTLCQRLEPRGDWGWKWLSPSCKSWQINHNTC